MAGLVAHCTAESQWDQAIGDIRTIDGLAGIPQGVMHIGEWAGSGVIKPGRVSGMGRGRDGKSQVGKRRILIQLRSVLLSPSKRAVVVTQQHLGLQEERVLHGLRMSAILRPMHQMALVVFVGFSVEMGCTISGNVQRAIVSTSTGHELRVLMIRVLFNRSAIVVAVACFDGRRALCCGVIVGSG